MKLVAYILLISCFLAACSKEVTDPNTYRVTVKENFTDPLKQLKNIQVDDYVPYIITLADSKEGGEYRLTSLKEGEQYHQTIGKDFVLSLTNDPKTPINKEQKYLRFSSKGTYSFYIRPLVPGTFKLTFELQKYVGDKAVGDAIKVNVSFNAVKIRMKYMSYPIGELIKLTYATLFIDGGNQEGDNYIVNENISNHIYAVVLMNDNTLIKVDSSEKEMIFFRAKGNSFPLMTDISVHKVFIKYIKLIQKVNNLSEFEIEYRNIEINNIEEKEEKY